MRITRLGDDSFLLDAEPAAAEQLRTSLTRYRLAARATIEPAEEAYGAIAVAGPHAAALIGAAFQVEPPSGTREGAGVTVAPDLHAVASAFCGQPAYELIGSRQQLPDAWDRLAAALPDFEGRPFGATAFETLRIESGVPRFGAELTEEVMPAEAGVVSRAVSFTKGCYIGQEPVARLHYRGHANRGLRRIVLDGPPPPPGTPVALAGREVGRVTSAAPSPDAGRAVALAIVRREVEPGDRVDVGGVTGELGAA
jgi:tRNA-modifying protein YgfZ